MEIANFFKQFKSVIFKNLIVFIFVFPGVYFLEEKNALVASYVLFALWFISNFVSDLHRELEKKRLCLWSDELKEQKKLLEFLYSEWVYPSCSKEKSEQIMKNTVIKAINILEKRIKIHQR